MQCEQSQINDSLMEVTSSVEDRVSAMLAEFSRIGSPNVPYDSSSSLRDALGLESLALVSLLLRMGDEFKIDVTEFPMELNSIVTVGDLYSLAYKWCS